MMVQALEFTPAEAAALVDLSEREVRKEIEYEVIDSSQRLSFSTLVYLYLVRRSSLVAVQAPLESEIGKRCESRQELERSRGRV